MPHTWNPMNDLTTPADETPAERLARLQADLAAKSTAAKGLASAETSASTALVSTGGLNLPATAMKSQMAAARGDLIRAQEQVRAAAALVKEEVERQTALMQAQMRAALAELEPLQEKVKMMEEGIWTVNLYLGRDEEIHPVTDGNPASTDEPLTIRQTVLFMDEEVAALTESGGMDFSNIDLFIDWLEDPTHRDLLVPEQRCVVAVKPRRSVKDYGNPWENLSKNEANRATYFVIRNGEKIFLMKTDFDVGDSLVPNRQEFINLFKGSRYNPETRQHEVHDLEPGSEEWLKAEKRAGARERHFMRIALILQGLIDRTTVLHPIRPGLSMLNQACYDEGSVVLLADDELAITSFREPFYDWLRRLNKDLRPGMRIIGSFESQDFQSMSERGHWGSGHERITPNGAEHPASNVIHYLDSRRDGGFVFKYVRTRKEWLRDKWGNEELRAPKNRASCVVRPNDKFIIPFDLVSVEEMQTYLSARTERHAYLDMVPLLKAAISAKEAEAATEAPFRALLGAAIANRYSVEHDDPALLSEVESLVNWFKTANKIHRPLVADSHHGDEAKALRLIVDEYGLRNSADRKADAASEGAAVAHLRSLHPDLMFVGRARDGKIVGFTPMPSDYPVQATGAQIYVREVKVGITLRGKTTVRDWVLPGNRHTKMRSLFENEQWKNWNRATGPNDRFTDPQFTTIAAQAELAARNALLTEPPSDRQGRRRPVGSQDLMAIAFDPTTKKAVVFFRPEMPAASEPVRASEYPRAEYLEVTCHIELKDGQPAIRYTSRPQLTEWYADNFGRGSLSYPWHDEDNQFKRPGLLLLDEGVLAQALLDRDVVRERAAAASRRREVVSRAQQSISAEWKRRADADRYTRFLDDYADPTLWEGHQKTLNPLVFPYNESSRYARSDSWFKENLSSVLTLLVDEHVDFDDLTVTKMYNLAREHGAGEWEVPADIADIAITYAEDPQD
jgi:hypothetical protein